MSNKSAEKDRKAKVAQMQAAQRAADRRRTLTVVGAAVAVVLVMAGAVTYAVLDERGKTPASELAKLGVPASAASCDAVKTTKASGTGDHVGPGTNKPDQTTVKYETVPPSFGPHYPQWEFPNRKFYTADDRPKMENLVHNLEHGYSVVWYDDTVKGDQLDALKEIAEQGNKLGAAKDKVIVTAYDESYGALPEGKHVAFAHWSAKSETEQAGNIQLCGQVSGEAAKEFFEKYPRTDAPEPGAS